MTKFIQCVVCGATVERKSPLHKYCSGCARKMYTKHTAESHKRIYDKHKAELTKHTVTPAKSRNGQGGLEGKSLGDVALEASAVGLSYGKFMEACASGKLSAVLAAAGMSEAEAHTRIRKAYAERESRRKNKKKKKKGDR